MLDALGKWIDSIPKPVRDFVEGLISVGVAGAVTAVLALNFASVDLTAKMVLLAALTGAIGAMLAYARRAITPPTL